jgi:hypothetical protein
LNDGISALGTLIEGETLQSFDAGRMVGNVVDDLLEPGNDIGR